MSSDVTLDDDAVKACADLVGRTGAKTFQIGYDEDPPRRWYAYAQYKGARLTVEDCRGPVEAADALSRKLLTGGKCTHCGGLITLTDAGAVAFPRHFTDGSEVTEETARAMPHCRWRRMGGKWERGCA